MKISIVGAGAIGGVIGAQLSRAGKEVELVDVAEDHIDVINQKGLTIKSQDEVYTVNIKAYSPSQLLERNQMLECVLLCVKAQFTQEALLPLLPLLNKDSFVISVQNGLCEMDIEEVVGKERTMGGFVNIFADYLEPGVINYGGKGSFSIGELSGEISPRLLAVEKEFSALDGFSISQNVAGYLWSKLAYGAMLTATALTNEKMADVFDNPRYRVMLMNLAGEVLSIANYLEVSTIKFDDWNPADAYPIGSRDLEKMNKQLDIHVQRLRGYSKVRSGIWRDMAVRKRKTEKPYHFIPIFKIADKAQIKLPLIKLLLSLLEDVENRERDFSTKNLEILLAKSFETYG